MERLMIEARKIEEEVQAVGKRQKSIEIEEIIFWG
jgi:hypothetical protein